MKTHPLLSRFDLVIDAPGNIQHLRKLVIHLAISGCLTADLTKGESSSELIEKIRLKRRALIDTGKLKTPRSLPPIDETELPVGCMEISKFERLEKIARLEKGSTGIQGAKPGDYPLVVMAEERSSCDHYDFDGCAAIVPMVSSSGHGNASLKRLHYQEGQFALGNILCAVLPLSDELISARFIFEYLTAFKEELLVSKMIGTANVSLTLGKIGEVPVPIVSRSIQRRVDELMALCDRLEAAHAEREHRRDRLTAAALHHLGNGMEGEAFRKSAHFYLSHVTQLVKRPEQISLLRQTILEIAVRGRLVPQVSGEEPAAALLKHIRAENERSRGDGKRRRDTELASIELARAPFDLPVGWTWARFPELGTFGRGKSKHRPRNDPSLFHGGTHRLIQTGDVARSHGIITTHTNMYNDVGLAQSFKWPKGTLCITIAANIADSGILDFDACFPDSVVGFIPVSVFPNARYFEYFIRTAKANLLEFAPATAQKNINLEILNAVLIPLPPLAEQGRIVAKVDELMTICDGLETQLNIVQTESRRLLEAVLSQELSNSRSEEDLRKASNG